MSHTISFEGVSDDLARITTDEHTTDYDAYDGAQFHITAGAERLQVTLDLVDESGCWQVGVGPTSEAHPTPAWPLALEHATDTSPRLTVVVPEGATLEAVA